jgi:hypothetical protein
MCPIIDLTVLYIDTMFLFEVLKIPDNIRLVHLPPYSPELNPVEHIGVALDN